MIRIDTKNKFNKCILSSLNRSITDKQRAALNNRLNTPHVKPVSIHRHKKYNSIVLGCINTNLSDNKPFYFLYWDNGQERGRGYDFMNNNDSYVLLAIFEEDQEKVV